MDKGIGWAMRIARALASQETAMSDSEHEPVAIEPELEGESLETGAIDEVSEEVADPTANGLSKKEEQRLRRREWFQQVKQAKKLKKKEERQRKIASGEIKLPVRSDPSLVPDPEVVQQRRQERKQAKTDAYLDACKKNFQVIFDCDWESDHNDTTLSSLTQQIMFCYGLNRKYPETPCFIHLANLGERTRNNLSKVTFENWVGVTTSAEDYLTDTERFTIGPATDGKKQLVYLTSDAEETLDALDPSHAYIIGAIVDRNRLKGATYMKAKGQGVRTAKLPIREHFALSATHVLTVNHVYEILLKFAAVGNWPDTLSAILPKRKEATSVEPSAGGAGDSSDDVAVEDAAPADESISPVQPVEE